MSSEIIIRNMTKADIAACAELMRYTWGEHIAHSQLMNKARLMRPNGAEEWAAHMLADSDCIVLCAEERGQVVGFISCQISDAPGYLRAAKQCYVYDLVVAPQAQKHGVGLQLEKAAEQAAKEAGAGIFLGDIYPYNDASRGLMKKLDRQLAYEVWYKYLD